jgi:hypothetical protein
MCPVAAGDGPIGGDDSFDLFANPANPVAHDVFSAGATAGGVACGGGGFANDCGNVSGWAAHDGSGFPALTDPDHPVRRFDGGPSLSGWVGGGGGSCWRKWPTARERS